MTDMANTAPERVDLTTTASGFARVSTFSKRQRTRLGLLLMFRYGFARWGVYVPPITDEAVYPDFVRPGMRIHTGWDNRMGYDLFASNSKSDAFLRRFYAKHCTTTNGGDSA